MKANPSKQGGFPLPSVGQKNSQPAPTSGGATPARTPRGNPNARKSVVGPKLGGAPKNVYQGPPARGFKALGASPVTSNVPTQRKASPYPDKGVGRKSGNLGYLGRFATGKPVPQAGGNTAVGQVANR